jgi:hypothetical protein
MQLKTRWFHPILLVLLIHSSNVASSGEQQKVDKKTPEGRAVLWQDPADMSKRNLFYGPGGRRNAPPEGPFTFVEEDTDGTQPKYDVLDRNGVKWKVKFGPEARPETVATRLIWAVGYFADEDYFVPKVKLLKLPATLKRGKKYFDKNGVAMNARLERARRGKKLDNWKWKGNPFEGSRELNGLRVVAVLINNWDLKDSNNTIMLANEDSKDPQLVYFLSDLGATFGATGWRWPSRNPKGELKTYRNTKFISKVTPEHVSFKTPTKPLFVYVTGVPLLFPRVHTGWIGREIPRNDVKWIGSLLIRLSSGQIRDAFRAAGYSAQEVEGFAEVLEDRIAALNDL